MNYELALSIAKGTFDHRGICAMWDGETFVYLFDDSDTFIAAWCLSKRHPNGTTAVTFAEAAKLIIERFYL